MLLAAQSGLGIVVLLTFAWIISENRTSPSARVVLVGLGMQIAVAAILLKAPGARQAFIWLNSIFMALDDATRAGTSLVFGYLGGAPLPFNEPFPGAGYILAFQSLPIVLVVSALSAVLFYWGVLQRVVVVFSALLQRAFGIGGAVGVSAAANIFVGMVEAPLLVRPYLGRLTRSELFMVMTVGMATIAGTVMVLYAGFVAKHIPGALGHLVAASLISVPAGIMFARIMVPATVNETASGDEAVPPFEAHEVHSTLEAVMQGTSNGLKLLLNIIAMLIVFVAIVALCNKLLALLPHLYGQALSLERLLGLAMAPVAWLIGIPWEQATTAGSLIGIKTVLNEFLAYHKLSMIPAQDLDDRSRLIITYALCGFANFGSLGIMLGGLTAIVPKRRSEIVGLGMKSIVSGTLATLTTGAVVGLLNW